MMTAYKILYEGSVCEIVEKKSRFIAHVFAIETEQEAVQFLEQIRKKYWDARHHCFAYVIGENGYTQRCSDDGEPSGTAGRPILEVLLGEEVHNVLVVVTRYFGGTLLGTGGLVRAYSKAAQEGLASSKIRWKIPAKKIYLETDYVGIGKIQYIAGQMEISISNIIYTEKVEIEIIVELDKVGSFEKKVTEATSGQIKIDASESVWFIDQEGKRVEC